MSVQFSGIAAGELIELKEAHIESEERLIVIGFTIVALDSRLLPRYESNVPLADLLVIRQGSLTTQCDLHLNYCNAPGIDQLPLFKSFFQQRVQVEHAFYRVAAAPCYVAPSLVLLQTHIALRTENIKQLLIVLHQHFEGHLNATRLSGSIPLPSCLKLFPNSRNYRVKKPFSFACALCDFTNA